MTGSRPKALVTAAVSGPGLDLLHELADLVLDSWLDQPSLRIYNAAQLAERAAAEGANIVIVESDVCGADLYEQPIMAVCSCRGDPTNVDVAAATAAGVPVLRAPGRNADAVAELAVALLFAATRGVVPADRDVREGEIYRDGKIPYQRYRAWELNGQTVGLVGLGAVGRALRWRLRGLGMDVLAYDPYAPDATSSFDELLAKSDVISVHAPVTAETTGMINADAFAKMKDGVVYLNTARAKIHDTEDLVAALASGKVRAAGLDHFEGEHLATDHPLTTFPQVVLTPHIGGATYDTESNHTRTIAEDLCRLMAGARPLNIVNPEVLPSYVAAPQPTIVATSIGFQAEGPDPANLRPGPSYRLAADLARAGAHPRLCIIATAVGDDSSRLAAAHNAFSKLGFISSHLTLFPMPNVPDVRAHLLAQDVIWVGGGSTANLLALWRLHGLDIVLRECWEAGVVLKGVSAGSLCWHVGGTTDSYGPTLEPVTNGLAFLPWSNSPHHDVEAQRRPLIHRLIAERTLPDGYATENGTGLVFFGTELQDAFTEVEGKLAYSLTKDGATTIEKALDTRLL